MNINDIKFFAITYDLKQSPALHKLIKRVLRLQYRIAHRRFVRDAVGSVDDLEELKRWQKDAENIELLNWAKHGPEPRSTFLFMPSGLTLRLPRAKRGEDIEDFLNRVISQLKAELEEPDSRNAARIGIDLAVAVHHPDG